MTSEHIMEFLRLLCRFDVRGLFIAPTTNSFIQFFRYIFVGAIATVADGGTLFLAAHYFRMNYLIAAVAGFFAGLAMNFALSRLLVFSALQSRARKSVEFVSYAIIGATGLALTLCIMYVFTEWLHIHYLASKLAATAIVLVWNYLARRGILYR